MKVQLWAFKPGSNDHVLLPQPVSWNASFVLSDVGSLTLTYPKDAPGVEILSGFENGVFVGCDIEVRVWNATAGEWVCPPNGRFEVTDWDSDIVQEHDMPTRQYTAQSWLTRYLTSVMQADFSNLNDSGNREFINKSYGEVASILINEAQNRGDAPDLTYQDLVTPGGNAPQYPVGATLGDVLSIGRDDGDMEWLMQPDATGQGRKLVMYDDFGTDLSGGDDPVVLREGVDFLSAPAKRSTRDMIGAALVQGDDGAYLFEVSSQPAGPYGVNASFLTASGIKDVPGLQVSAMARLHRGEAPRTEYTKEILFAKTKFFPFRDYTLGDTVLAPDEDGNLVPLRVRQVTLTFDDKGVGGNLVLGDRFTERTLRLERIASRTTRNASQLSGNGGVPVMPAPPIMPSDPAEIGGGLTLYSRLGMVELYWDGLDANGNPMGASFDYAYAERSTAANFSNAVPTGHFNSEGYAVDGPLTIGTRYYYRLVTVNKKGIPSTPGVSGYIDVVGVQGPDLEANSVTANAINVGYLSAISSNLGSITAGSINAVSITGSTISGNSISGGTVTGTTVRTAASGSRVQLVPSGGWAGEPGLEFYYNTTKVGAIYVGPNVVNMEYRNGSTTANIGWDTFGTLSMQGSSSINIIAGSGGVTVSGGGTWYNGLSVSGGLSVTGGLTVSGGIQAASVINSGGNLQLSGNRVYSPAIYADTTTSAANVYVTSNGYLMRETSVRASKKDIRYLKPHYEILDLPSATWIDRKELDDDPSYDIRTAGNIAEDLEALSAKHGNSLEPLLVRENGELKSITYSRIPSYLIPVIKDMNERLTALETQQ